jgi:post-segregation antitoxin (ccd killing protein)
LARLNITIPDELHVRIEKWRERLNISRVCQDAIRRELDKLEQLPEEVRHMHEALSRLGQQKARVERSSFRKGVHDGLEWARQAEYPLLKHWGERTADGEFLGEVLKGPAASAAATHSGDAAWEPKPYAEGWIAGVQQFWERARSRL